VGQSGDIQSWGDPEMAMRHVRFGAVHSSWTRFNYLWSVSIVCGPAALISREEAAQARSYSMYFVFR